MYKYLKTQYIYFILLLLTPNLIFCSQVSKEKATLVAKNVLYERSGIVGKQLKSGNKLEVEETITLQHLGKSVIYVINFKTGGYVLLSADDKTKAVLGYSVSGHFSETSCPLQLLGLIEGYKEEISEAQKNTKLKSGINKEWSKYNDKDFTPSLLKSGSNISPLLSSKWGQGSSDGVDFNYYCPANACGHDGRAYVGCVATAMSQIMNYHKYPKYGVGESHSYTPPSDECNENTISYSAQTVSYTYDYNWAGMDDIYGTTASALLSYHAGVSVDMEYGGTYGSSAFSKEVPDALRQYFGYSSDMRYVYKDDYSDAWINMLIVELQKSRPVYYSGVGDNGGHAFVVDGYDGSEFHVNWGWSGDCDGYYTLSDLTTSSGLNFNSTQGAIFNIHPSCLTDESIILLNTFTTTISDSKHFNSSLSIETAHKVANGGKAEYHSPSSIKFTLGYKANAGCKVYASLKPCDCSETDPSSSPSSTLSSARLKNLSTLESNGISNDVLDLIETDALVVKISPNPTSSKITISDLILGSKIEISDSYGMVIERRTATDTSEEIDLSGNPIGLYLVKVINGDQIFTEKVMLQ